ncbi:microfibril-associated glycoprotein 4-like [Babylonia areolata]|uniref:microfibril-associated glycoprotein 4-like n=1 Tax=Babylonia areolata TaxID=304850 RepID=UPI003FCF42BB
MGTVSTFTRLIALCVVLQGILLKETESSSTGGNTNNVFGKRLVQPLYCSSDQVLVEDSRYRSTQVRSKLECVGECRRDPNCRSVVFDVDLKVCHLGDAKAAEDCSNMNTAASPSLSFYQEPPPCGDKETMGPLGLCVCAPGYTGVPCQKYLHDCSDVQRNGEWQDTYTISPLQAPSPFQVNCRRVSSTRTYILDRRRTAESFTRSWQDYRDGFGSLDDDYWIGLENVHALTVDRDQELRVNIKVQNNSNYLLSYQNFRVSDEGSGYRLYFNTSALNSDNDCLEPLHGVRFSTYDHDRDGSGAVNCAERKKGGFWFSGSTCSVCNPMGVLYQPTSGRKLGVEGEATWDSLVGDVAIFKISMYLIPMLV